MEKHTCKLCFRSFANGRALGGHMRSHVAASTKAAAQLIKDSPSSSPSESFSSRDDDEHKMMMTMMGPLGYGLRENPKKSFRLVDPEFSSTFPAVDASSAAATPAAGSSAVVQDRESETESSRAPTTADRRRSKRARKAATAAVVVSQHDPLPLAEPEPVSSVSDTTPEEDVAISLMMLSRDFWAPITKSEEHQQQQKQKQKQSEQQFIIEDEGEEDEIEVEAYRARNRNHQHPVKGRSKHQCGTCKKVFRSYQALGGHRASHKKTNGCVPPPSPVARAQQFQIHYEGGESSEANAERVQHECPVCFRVFSSGQALGGHKRSHLTNSTATITITSSSSIAPAPAPAPAPAAPIAAAVAATKYESLIDLNLPAPMEDDAELSAVSMLSS